MSDKNYLVKFSPLENALNFTQKALEYLSVDRDPKELKYAVLHLHSGIEIILKARLLKEHWTLVFSNIDRANKEAFESGDFKSVGLDESVNRLRDICGVEISEKNFTLLKAIKDTRNKLEHFAVEYNTYAIKSYAAKAVSFIISFISEGLEISNTNEIKLIDAIRALLGEFDEFVEQRHKEIKSVLEEIDRNSDLRIVQCPMCFEDTLIIGEETPKCCFCEYSATGEKVALEYAGSILRADWSDMPIDECPECYAEAFVRAKNSDSFFCFECGNEWDLDEITLCSRCGHHMLHDLEDDADICENCWEYIFDKD